MFVLYDKEAMNVPVKVWLPDEAALEASCREQHRQFPCCFTGE